MNYYKMGIVSNDISFSLYQDTFLTHHTGMLMLKDSSLPIRAYTVDILEKNNNLLSTIGELFEREILINKNQKSSKIISGFSLIDGTCKTIPKRDVIFVDKFVDSCGMASHTNSYLLIKKAVLEFFERQCLVLSYLSKKPACKVADFLLFEIKELSVYKEYLYNFVDEYRFYNISISNQVYVILGIGFGGQTKCIGIGTSENLIEALKKAMQEMLQYFMCAYSKSFTNTAPIVDNNDQVRDLYHTYFDNITSNELKRKYSYLEGNYIIKAFDYNKKFNLGKFLWELKSTYGMNPYVFYFPNQRNLANTKTIKIVDFNWFPNIYPATYKEDVYRYIEEISNCKLEHNCQYIPFP